MFWKNKKIGNHGFIISFDALFALLVFFVFFTATAGYLASVEFNASDSAALKKFAMGSLAVLEQNGKLERAVLTGKVSKIRSFLNKMPYSICGEIMVYDTTDFDTAEFSVLRPGCNHTYDELATIQRSFVINRSGTGQTYLAEFRAWYRVI